VGGLGLLALGGWHVAAACGGTVALDSGSVPQGDAGTSSASSSGSAAAASHADSDVGSEPGAGGASLSDAYFVVPVDQSQLAAASETACTGWATENGVDGLTLMLTVDMSESMLATAAATEGRTKWDVTRSSVSSAVAGWSEDTALGMLLFPNLATSPGSAEREPSACVAADALLPLGMLGTDDHRSMLLTALQSAAPVSPAATPLYDAYTVALEHFAMIPTVGSKHMVLVTDGQPTLSRGCLGVGETDSPVDGQPIIDEIAMAYQDMGIRTLVVGTPGSEANATTGADARPWLSAAALAGATARPGCSHTGPEYCHLDMSGEPDFASALLEALPLPPCSPPSCHFPVPLPPEGEEVDLDAITVFYADIEGGPYLVRESDTTPCERGWHLTADDTRIEVCGETCEWLATSCGRAEIMFGCQ
jgi:hypothetical protein